MDYLEGYQGQFGQLPAQAGAYVWSKVYKLVKPNEQETGTKYIKSGYPIRSRTRMPPDGRMTWVTPEDMEYIVITIVDGADTVLRKIQVFAVNQLKKTLPGAPANAQFWDMRLIGWKGTGKDKWFKADPSRGDYYYYVDGDLKQVAVVEQETGYYSNQAQQAASLSQQAAAQGNTDLATKYQEMAMQLAQQTEASAQKAQSDASTQAAALAQAAALQAQATLDELKKMMAAQGEGKMPSWIWIAVAAGALLLFRSP